MVREINSASQFLAQGESVAHFGLGGPLADGATVNVTVFFRGHGSPNHHLNITGPSVFVCV